MKVTVCFGPVSVVVPCGNGEILVRDLTEQAVTRYKKASNKSSDAFVAVSALRSSDGAILDPDDRLADVVDDREQLVACYRERDSASRGDGTSASSNSASPSPDFLASRKDIEVTGHENADLLHVRRGSEPTLARNIPTNPGMGMNSHELHIHNEHKRWSAVPAIDRGNDSDSDADDRRNIQRPTVSNFARSGARISMQIFSSGTPGYRWAEAADNALLSAASSPPDYEETMRRTRSMRREPVGSCESPIIDGESGNIVVLPNEGGPLGIHVVPCYSVNGEENGLLVQGIEAGGRVSRDGRISVQDRIVEINGQPLHNVPFQRAQEIFRSALQSRQLALRIARPTSQQSLGNANSITDPASQQNLTGEDRSSRVAAVSPTRKPAQLPGTRSSALMTVSSRKIGKKLEIELVKGSAGLGFSLTTRDNPAGGQCPIYIKNILPKGAAIEDGRLKPGDRLLEINETEVTGKTQEEVVALLRSIPAGGAVQLVISRQEAELESPKLPRQMKTMRASEESLAFPWKQRHILNFDIPVHDTEKAGLGISVKGKTCTNGPAGGTTDLGIFIKSVLHGGAASRDGRLQTNDQLLHVNGVPLLGRSNTEAMEVLRRAVHQEGPKPGHITLTIARKSIKEVEDNTLEDSNSATVRIGGDSTSSNDQSGGSSDQSGSTVIFVSGSGENVNAAVERNPVIDRITGRQDLRNESYYRATNETWNATQLQEALNARNFNLPQWKTAAQNSPTVHLPPGEVVSIDGDYVPQQRGGRGGALLSFRTTTPDVFPAGMGKTLRPPPVDGRDYGEPPTSPTERDSIRSDRPSDSDAPTYASQTSLEDSSSPVFSRDQIGRQSMSEKRHATLDAKSTDTYQRSKKQREERERSKQEQQQPQQQQLQPPPQQQQQPAKENFPPPGKGFTNTMVTDFGRRRIRRGVKRRHPLISRLERDYLNSPPYRSSPDLTQQDVGVASDLRRTALRASQFTIASEGGLASVESLASPLPSPTRKLKEVPEPRKQQLPPRDLGPTLGLKKSSSLESLQTAVQEIQMREDDDDPSVGCYGYRPTAIKVVRGRGCNDSFRAAVDRSYEPGENKEPMETLDEECNDPVIDADLLPESDMPLDNKNHMRKSKKKSGLLRGLGSMFRFGKNRKIPITTDSDNKSSPPPPPAALHERRPSGPAGLSSARPEVDRHNMLRRTLPSNDRDRAELGRQMALAAARQAAQEEQRRIQQHYQRIMEQQQHQQQQQQQLQDLDPAGRSQRLNQLRAQHQRRHAEKQGAVPQEQQQLYEVSKSPVPVNHGRSSSYDPYNDIRKPRSRTAVGEPASFVPLASRQQEPHLDGNRLQIELSSNGNLSPNQISQMQQIVKFQRLKVEAENINRRQQHYHSQRSARDYRTSSMGSPTGSDRPVSNYFEYESLRIAGHTIALSGPPYRSQQQQQQQNHYAGSSLPRQAANPNERNYAVPASYANHSSRPVSAALAGSKV